MGNTRSFNRDKDGVEIRTCTKCPRKEIYLISVIEHAYSGWVTTIEPTETEDGEETRTCSACGHKETNTLGALGNPNCLHSVYGE